MDIFTYVFILIQLTRCLLWFLQLHRQPLPLQLLPHPVESSVFISFFFPSVAS